MRSPISNSSYFFPTLWGSIDLFGMNSYGPADAWMMTSRSNHAHQGPPPPPTLFCTYCSYSTSIRTNYLKHIRKHTGEKPYACTRSQFKMVLIALEERARMWKAVESVSRDIHGWITAVNSLRSLYMEAQQLNAIAEPHIKAAFPQYYSELGALLEVGFWEVPLTTKVFNITARPLSSPSKVLNGVEQLVESQSDKCVTEAGRAVLKGGDGSQNKEDDVDGQGQCSLSQKCWDLMTKPGYSGYSLTHQAFYLLIGLQAGCGDQEERFAYSTFRNGTRMTVTTLLEQICASVLIEANTIAQAGFPETRRDLFMEQGALCGMVGYRDFFRKQWLTKVLSWQRSLGCFGDLLLYNGIRSHLSVTNKLFPPHHSRVKREESPMAGRCLAHRTAVAVGYLSLYVRYLALALFK